MWDHPVSSASISRDYVRNLLGRRNKNKVIDITDSKILPHTKIRSIFDPPPNPKLIIRQGFAFTGRDKADFGTEFLPLTYLAKVLSDIEEQGNVGADIPAGFASLTPAFSFQALNPFGERENVDAAFVEETALKQTLILLGFETK